MLRTPPSVTAQCTSAWLSMSENLPGGVGRQGITDRLRPLRRLRPLIHKFFEYYYSYFIAQSDKTRNTFACHHTASEKTFILHHLKIRRNLPPRRVVWSVKKCRYRAPFCTKTFAINSYDLCTPRSSRARGLEMTSFDILARLPCDDAWGHSSFNRCNELDRPTKSTRLSHKK